ncbi:MAG: phage tail protein [Oscillospiraceae bacterium]
MKRSRSYFIFNKETDYRRGWLDNIACEDTGIRAENPDRAGVLWSRLLDSREKETPWHRLTMDSTSLGEASVRFAFYCAESRTALWQGQSRDLGELLRDPALTDRDREELSAPYLVKTALNPKDILLHELTGRYVWFRAELRPQGGQSPAIGNLKLRFPKETWLQYLPEVYQDDPAGKSFTERFLGIFQSLYSDLDEEIREVARNFDPDVVGGAYLEWLASWLDVEDGYLWPEEKLRLLVRHGMELYRIRGTRRYVTEMVKLYTGQTPWVVEHSGVEPYLSDVGKTALLRELYGDSPYMVTLILDGSALADNEAHRALLRIVDNAKPAWIEVNLVVLKPYIFLDKYTYLGINSTLDRYRPLHLDGYSALPFTRLGGLQANS